MSEEAARLLAQAIEDALDRLVSRLLESEPRHAYVFHVEDGLLVCGCTGCGVVHVARIKDISPCWRQVRNNSDGPSR